MKLRMDYGCRYANLEDACEAVASIATKAHGGSEALAEACEEAATNEEEEGGDSLKLAEGKNARVRQKVMNPDLERTQGNVLAP